MPPPPSGGGADLDAAFAAVNTSRSGRIVPSEVQAALAAGGMVFSLQAAGLMVRLHDADGDGSISRAEFGALHASLDGLATAFAEGAGGGGDGGGGSGEEAATLPAAKVAAALASAGVGPPLDPPALAAAVKAFDPDRKGAVGLTEFIGLALFVKGSGAAFRAFDAGGTGSVSLTYDQFVYAAAACR
jgi:hypothetical protein